MAECAMAAKELFSSDVTPVDDNYGSRWTPKGCYFDDGELKFNVKRRVMDLATVANRVYVKLGVGEFMIFHI